MVTPSNTAKAAKAPLPLLYIGSIPQPTPYIPVSFSLLDETQAREAVGPGAKFISDALAALHPEFESISSPAV